MQKLLYLCLPLPYIVLSLHAYLNTYLNTATRLYVIYSMCAFLFVYLPFPLWLSFFSLRPLLSLTAPISLHQQLINLRHVQSLGVCSGWDQVNLWNGDNISLTWQGWVHIKIIPFPYFHISGDVTFTDSDTAAVSFFSLWQNQFFGIKINWKNW